MSYDSQLISKVRDRLQSLPNVSEKKMFGKLAFMVNDKLCIAVGKEDIMCRINPSLHDASLEKKEYKAFKFGWWSLATLTKSLVS